MFLHRILWLLVLLSWTAWAQPSLAQHLPELELQTSFAHDYGDILDSIRFQGKTYEPSQATRPILSAVGWSTRADKLALGEAWAREVVFFGSQVLEDRQPAPKAELLADGTFRFTAFVMNLRGREPGGVSQKRVEISPAAELKVTQLSEAQTRP